MPDAYVERLAAILLQHEDACEPPSGVPAVVWGSLRDSGLSSGAWNNSVRLSKIRTALISGDLSSKDRKSLYSDVFIPLRIRRNCIVEGALYFFHCFDISVAACNQRHENPRVYSELCSHEKSGPYSGISTIWRDWDKRSHLMLFMDFFAHFCRYPYSPDSIMRSFGRAYNEYRVMAADEPTCVSGEVALIFFHAVLDGRIFCRFEDKSKQYGFRLADRDENSRGTVRQSSTEFSKLKGPRFGARKNGRRGVIRPAKRALYRLRFLDRLGYRFAPGGDQHRRLD